jgi:diketogulonate reductase-like aldo/keto reductase
MQPELSDHNPLCQLLDHEDVMKIARRRNLSPAALLLRWGLRKNLRSCSLNFSPSAPAHCLPLSAMVVKTVKANRLIENLKTFEMEITQQEIEMLDSLEENVHYCWDPAGIP